MGLTPEEMDGLNTDIVVVFHSPVDAQLTISMYNDSVRIDKGKLEEDRVLESKPPLILEGHNEEGDGQEDGHHNI